jgi:hypothetical protein
MRSNSVTASSSRLRVKYSAPRLLRAVQSLGSSATAVRKSLRFFPPPKSEIRAAELAPGTAVSGIEGYRLLRLAQGAIVAAVAVVDHRQHDVSRRVVLIQPEGDAARSKGADDFGGADALTRIQAHFRCEHTPILSGSSAPVLARRGEVGAI